MPAYPCCSNPFTGRSYTSHFPLSTNLLLLLSCLAFSGQAFAQCYTPGNVGASNIQTDQVMLSWQDVNNTSVWEIELRTGNQPFLGIVTHTALNNPFLLSGLTPATSYRLRIRAVCSGGNTKSSWSFIPFEFATAFFNPSPCGLFFKVGDDNCPAGNKFYIDVNNAGGVNMGTDVTLRGVNIVLRHTFLADLHIKLLSPSGKSVWLFQEHGQSRDHLGNPADPTCNQICRFSSTDCSALNPVEHTGGYINVFLPDENLHEFDDGSDPNGIWELIICDDAKADTGSLRFLELDFMPVSCPSVYNAELIEVGEDSATIRWSYSGNCSDLIMEYGPPGFIPGTNQSPGPNGTIVIIPCNNDSMTVLKNLLPGTDFELYLRTSCSTDQYSENSCPITFSTACPMPEYQINLEDFDNLTPCGSSCACGISYPLNSIWKNTTLLDDFDWLVRNGPASVTIQTGPFSDISGSGNYLYLETLQSYCQDGATAELRSECLIVEDPLGAECQFSFNYNMWGAAMGTLAVEATRDGGASWDQLWSLSGNQGSSWHQVFISLSAYTGDTIQLRILGTTGSARTSQMAIDELKLAGITILGNPGLVHYRDFDGDGFGDPNTYVETCTFIPPVGFVSNASDCNDANALANPLAFEVPCNGEDENCNGSNDDAIAPLPDIADVSICRGQEATLEVISFIYGQIYWYNQSSGGQAFHVGNSFQTGPLYQQVTYYIADSSSVSSCNSSRRPVTVFVRNAPLLDIPEALAVCAGDSVDLKSINILDLQLSGATLTFHDATPANIQNVLQHTVVYPTVDSIWYALATTPDLCSAEIALTFGLNPKPSISLDNQIPITLCAGKSTLVITAIEDGIPPYQYNWSHGYSQEFAPIIAGVTAGTKTYGVSVTDANGCKDNIQFEVITLSSLGSVNISTTDVTTCGGLNGSISISPVGGGTYDYAWSGPISGMDFNKQGAFVISGLKQGSYSLSITNSTTGCIFIPPIIIVNGPGPAVQQLSLNHESCPGNSDGSILLTINGPPATFSWSHGPTTKDVFDLQPGSYAVTISGGSCSFIIEGLDILPASPIITGAILSHPACAGYQTGLVNLTLSGGSGGYVYKWNNGAVSQDIQALGPGSYWATIVDNKGCQVVSDTFIIISPPLLDMDYNIQPLSCYGQNDGVIQVVAMGGTQPFHWSWADGASTKDRNGLSAGYYRLTVTDQLGCKATSGDIEMPQPPLLQAQWTDVRPETCDGSADGMLQATVTGGTAPWVYFWSFGVGNTLADQLKAGDYGLTVTDAQGCNIVLPPVSLGYAAPMDIEIIERIDPTCNFLADGHIISQVTGGLGVYEYLWSNGMETEILDGVPAGNYSVTITDSSGCTVSTSGILLKEKSPVSVSLIGVTFPGCEANSYGNIDISVTGVAPFMYSWSHGFTEQNPVLVAPGYYSVTVTDANGCAFDLNSIPVLNTATNFQVVPILISDLTCAGDQDGAIYIQVNGGEAPYQFNWSTGQEKDLEIGLDEITGLASGEYSVTITDNRGCVLVHGPMVVDQPPPLELSVPVALIRNESCQGLRDGGITLDITGGVPPYSVFWFKDSLFFPSSPSPQHLGPGKYTALVIDDMGCARSLNQAIEIIGPPSLFQWQTIEIDHADCESDTLGMITIKLEGGVSEYSYSWSDGGIDRVRTMLTPGNYCVTATDQFNCKRDTCLQLLGGTKPEVDISVINECDPFSVINTNVSQGVMPYSYLWSNGDTTSQINGAPTGTYSVTVTDVQGCITILKDIQVGHPILTIASITSLPATSGLMDGKAIVLPSGGTAPYSIQWDVNAKSQTTDTAFQLAPGIYCVLVTDIYNCFDTACVEVFLSTSTDEAGPWLDFKVYPNPVSESIYVATDEWNSIQQGPFYISLISITGLKTNLGTMETSETQLHLPLLGIAPGFYILEVRDKEGTPRFFQRVFVIPGR